MSRPQKKHKPLKGDFNSILAAIAMGTGKGKRAALDLQSRAHQDKIVRASQPSPKPKK